MLSNPSDVMTPSTLIQVSAQHGYTVVQLAIQANKC